MKKALIIGLICCIVVGLGVGLGVGLTRGGSVEDEGARSVVIRNWWTKECIGYGPERSLELHLIVENKISKPVEGYLSYETHYESLQGGFSYTVFSYDIHINLEAGCHEYTEWAGTSHWYQPEPYNPDSYRYYIPKRVTNIRLAGEFLVSYTTYPEGDGTHLEIEILNDSPNERYITARWRAVYKLKPQVYLDSPRPEGTAPFLCKPGINICEIYINEPRQLYDQFGECWQFWVWDVSLK